MNSHPDRSEYARGSAVSRLCSGDSVNNRLSSILHSYACVLKAPLLLRSVSHREERFPCNGRVRLRCLQNKRKKKKKIESSLRSF